MINVKFYLDKADKSKKFPIHLVLRKKDKDVFVLLVQFLQRLVCGDRRLPVLTMLSLIMRLIDWSSFRPRSVRMMFEMWLALKLCGMMYLRNRTILVFF